VEPTDTGNPDYYHRVVDCQWACPAHTDVPEYIRLIAQGQFGEAYLVNRESNVFPACSVAFAIGRANRRADAVASKLNRSPSAA
jgi:NADPH-dependent glutamate synthase beta subunit-like oxidoreductase